MRPRTGFFDDAKVVIEFDAHRKKIVPIRQSAERKSAPKYADDPLAESTERRFLPSLRGTIRALTIPFTMKQKTKQKINAIKKDYKIMI